MALEDLSAGSRTRADIEKAIHAANRAADLTRQMLAYSGKGGFLLHEIDLSELVEENAHMLRAGIPKGVALNLRLAKDLPPILADTGQIQQVVMNLITNAAEAIGDGPGVVRVSTATAACDEERFKQNSVDTKPTCAQCVCLEVSDTGCGMDAETTHRLFDPFFTTKFIGRGLGMSAVQGIVRGHNGALFVESEPGKGTTIRVLFPVSETARKEMAPEPDGLAGEHEAARPSGLILLVDDEESVRQLGVKTLARLGYRTLEAADGEEAVMLFREHVDEIACVILDLTMPRMDGVAAFEELQGLKPGVRVILSSGYDEREATHRIGNRGLAGFVQKPYRIEALKTLLADVLRED